MVDPSMANNLDATRLCTPIRCDCKNEHLVLDADVSCMHVVVWFVGFCSPADDGYMVEAGLTLWQASRCESVVTLLDDRKNVDTMSSIGYRKCSYFGQHTTQAKTFAVFVRVVEDELDRSKVRAGRQEVSSLHTWRLPGALRRLLGSSPSW